MSLILAIALAVMGVTSAPELAIRGDANFADPGYGPGYLAVREWPVGTRVTVCGEGDCARMRVTSYGPAKRTGDIADIGLRTFAKVCGYTVREARIRGECTVTISAGWRDVALPPTDTAWTYPAEWLNRHRPAEYHGRGING